MNFQLKNFMILKTLKTFYIKYYKILLHFITDFLKKYLDEKIYLYSNKCVIYLLSDMLFFKTTNLTSNIIDNIQEFNPKILIFLPLKICNIQYNINTIIYYLLGEFPKFISNKDLIINGIKKTFVSKLSFKNLGIFFNKFTKNFNEVIYAKIILKKAFIINLVLTENNCFCIINNSIKFNFISFLYALGISTEDIFSFSKYKDSFYLKKLLIESKPTLEINNNIKYYSLFFKILFKLNIYYIFSKILNKQNLNIRYSIFNTSKFIILDFIALLDLLLDIKFNKKVLNELESLESRYISTLGEYSSLHYSSFILKNAVILQNDISEYVKHTFKIILNTPKIYFKSKAYFTLKKYLTTNPFVQYLEETNSFSEIVHKNRVTNYNSKSKQSLQIRNINLNQIGYLCLLDTIEGINCGLVVSFTKNAKIEKKNNIQFPYSLISHVKTKTFVKFINSFDLKIKVVLFNNYYLRKNKIFNFINVGLSKENFKLKNISLDKVIYIKPNNLFSYAENLIPFLFFDDPARGLMGAKMQTQALPVLNSKKSFIITGNEKYNLNLNNTILKTYQEGVITYVSSFKIILCDLYKRKITYYLEKYKHSNQSTIKHQKPNVWVGERVFCGQFITFSSDILYSEFTAGNNLIVSYGNFFGYNFEDAIVINKKIIYSQLFTSLHFNVYEVIFKFFNSNKFEVSSNNLPKKSFFCKRNLDFFGIIKEGTKVLNNDILVSKILINNLMISTLPLFNVLSILFGQEIKNLKNNSICISFGNSGRVVKTEIFVVPYILQTEYYLKCRIYICKQRLLSVGDKLCGRHGNKGIIAYIASVKDIPYTNNGIIPDIISDTLGIPSRMNLGQLFESLFGIGCYFTNKRLCITNKFTLPKFYIKALIYNYLKQLKEKIGNTWIYNSYMPGQIFLRDGRTGYKLSKPSFLGISKYSKLIHMVKDKIHYRTIGPYSEIVQQPLKGRSNKGGQRFGEMEIWALEVYGGAYNLRELLNYKSDDIIARSSLLQQFKLNSISTTESFRVLMREIYSMNLNIEVFSNIDQIEGQTLAININT